MVSFDIGAVRSSGSVGTCSGTILGSLALVLGLVTLGLVALSLVALSLIALSLVTLGLVALGATVSSLALVVASSQSAFGQTRIDSFDRRVLKLVSI